MDRGRRISFIVFTIFTTLLLHDLHAQTSYSPFTIYEENGSKGIVNAEGEKVIPANYYDLGWTRGLPEFFQNVIGYKESDVWGLLNSNNKIITPPKYTHLYPAGNSSLIIAAVAGRFSGESFFGVINSSGKVVIPFMYAGVEVVNGAVIVKTLDANRSKFGLVDMANQPILPNHYIQISQLTPDLLAISKPDNKIALINSKGKEMIRYELDSIREFMDGYFKIFKDGKIGILSIGGEILLMPEYKKVEMESSGNSIRFLNLNKWEFIDADNQTQDVILADDISDIANGILKITINNRSWLMDKNYNLKSGIYNSMSFSYGNLLKTQRGQYRGLINMRNEEILSPEFDHLEIKGPYVYALKKNGSIPKWYIYDTLGIRKSHFIYQDVQPVSSGLIPVKRNSKWGFMNRNGVEIINCVFDEASPFQNNLSVVTLHGEEGIINTSGDWVVLPGPKNITLIGDTLYLERTKYHNRLVSLDKELVYFTNNDLQIEDNYLIEEIDSTTTWFISLKGTILSTDATIGIPPVSFYDSLHIVRRNSETGVYSDTGKEIIPFGQWEEIYPPTEGFLGISSDGFYGFIDINNKLRIANRYEGIGPFTEGLAAVKVRGLWGFIDMGENLVCQPLYDEVGEFNSGICMVRAGDKWGLIDNEGRIIQETEFDYLDRVDKNFIISSKDDLLGLIDNSGNTVLFPKYEELEILENDRILVKRKGKYGVVDMNGVNLIPNSYNSLTYVSWKASYLTMQPGDWQTMSIE